ncbi:hypothetical protein JOF56_000474 [Kibdelosporangium banguiense]|uniref:DUF222 domain-containing protein n=1 Tax=Kibdelosporangium banguiense TaxID=1365924 RepID=A0ABS4T6Q0_9PSEU|nr:DUF222 domain-containing protein [Kibdelosporangium banguiense]MBP2320089.1 hypothetical protein [Kibdelosporangium banguiense]
MTNNLTEPQVLKMIVLAERMQSYWSAVQIRALSTFAEYRPPGRAGIKLADGAYEEIAAVLSLSIAAATNRLIEAEEMVRRLPATVTALEEGIIDMPRAKATVQVTKPLCNEDASKVEQAVLRHGRHTSCKEYRRALRRQAMKVDPEAAERKRKQVLEDRDVVTRKAEDGSMKLVAKFPAHETQATYNMLDNLAHLAKTADDTRTLAQRRADVLRDLVLGKDMERVRVNVNVTVPLTTLIGLNRHPGELSEYGPITAEQCRELAGNATFRRLVTDEFGHLLEVDRDSHPATGFGDVIRVRDRTCRQPGCAVPARKCDVVHVSRCKSDPSTCARDCGLLCKRHRLMRMRTNGWLTTQPVPGYFVFVTPSGCVRQVPVERLEEPAA